MGDYLWAITYGPGCLTQTMALRTLERGLRKTGNLFV